MDFNSINAMPTKKLFIDTLIRDVSLKDAVLDLVDNAIDGYIRHNYNDTHEIKISITGNKFEIEDNCGGIEINHVIDEVFRFGVTDVRDKNTLGVYGIGLKRSMFKIGKLITFESDDLSKYFKIIINLEEWENSTEWSHEFDEVKESTGKAFTKISIQILNEDISSEFVKETFQNGLIQRISKTYFLFLKDKINIYLNNNYIEPIELKIGFSDNIAPAVNAFSLDDVSIKLTAGAHPDYKDPGWYIFCNDRLIIVGDRTSLTGWGSRGVPLYHPKFNRFKGFAYIKSPDPSKLPWNTSKNGLNTSSYVYKKMLDEMQTITQQFTSYMSKVYPTDKEETLGKDVLGDMDTISVGTLGKNQNFKAPIIPKTPTYATIRYKKPKEQVEKLKICLGSTWLTNIEVGERTFDYYREMECPEDE
jgi:histidine kinase/DNA gyrase B/HSP90-like ATPase